MIDWNDKSWINYVDAKVWENLPESSLKSRNNSEITFRCPICGDSKKNRLKKRGYFYRKTGTFYCFNCGTNMTGYDFLKAICPKDVFDRIIQDYKVLNFDNIVRGRKVEAIQPQRSTFEILAPNPSYRYLLDAKWVVKPLSDYAKHCLDDRKIPVGSRNMLKSIVDPNGREFILIQYIWDDSCIYHQLWNASKYDINGQGSVKYIFPKDENINFQPKPVFNIGNVDVSHHSIYCTEGVFDSLFIKNGVALGGRSLTDYQYRMLTELYPRHKIVLAFDHDYAGMSSSIKHAEKYPNISFLDISDLMEAAGTKDLNDFVKVTGRSDVFMNENFLKERTISAFQVEMKLKLKR